jgi:hypothetical protein
MADGKWCQGQRCECFGYLELPDYEPLPTCNITDENGKFLAWYRLDGKRLITECPLNTQKTGETF